MFGTSDFRDTTPDQETLLRAIEDARLILGEYVEPGPRDATQTVERLATVTTSYTPSIAPKSAAAGRMTGVLRADKAQAVAASLDARSAESWAMPALTRRRYPERQDCRHVYYGDVQVGTIARLCVCDAHS